MFALSMPTLDLQTPLLYSEYVPVYKTRSSAASISHIVADQDSIHCSESVILAHPQRHAIVTMPSVLNLPTVNVLRCGSLAMSFIGADK